MLLRGRNTTSVVNTAQFPLLLNDYVARNPRSVPGVDYYVGAPTDIVFKNPLDLTGTPDASGISRSANRIFIAAGGTLDGYDLRLGGLEWYINLNTSATIKNSYLKNNAISLAVLSMNAGQSGTVVQDCTFDGGQTPGAYSSAYDVTAIQMGVAQNLTITRCEFKNILQHHVQVGGGVFSCTQSIFYGINYGGGVHGDFIFSNNSQRFTSFTVQDCLFYNQPGNGLGINSFAISCTPVSNPFDWSPVSTYAANAGVRHNMLTYRSLLASNVNHQPDVSPTWWLPIECRQDALDIRYNTFVSVPTSPSACNFWINGTLSKADPPGTVNGSFGSDTDRIEGDISNNYFDSRHLAGTFTGAFYPVANGKPGPTQLTTYGGRGSNIDMLTGAVIGSPSFTLPTISAAAHNTVYTARFVWTGVGSAISVTGGQYRKNGGALTSSAGTLATNDVVDVLMNGPAAVSSSASMTCTVGGVTRTMTVNSGTAKESLLYFFGPHNTLAQEAALGGDWLAHKNLMDTYRPDNLRWLQMGVQYDPALAYYIRAAREVIGSAGAIDDAGDGNAYMDAPLSGTDSGYVASNPNLFHSSDAHMTSKDAAAYYLMTGAHLDWPRAVVNNAEWQYEETNGPHTGYNPAAVDWTQRSMSKHLGGVVVGRWVGATVGGPIGVIVGNYTGGVAQLAADYVARVLEAQGSDGAWRMAHSGTTMTKPWQDTLIVNNLILYHKNFDPLNDTLKAAILKNCEWLWCMFSQYSNPVGPVFSTASGKWTAIYMDQYWSDPNSGGAPDGLNGSADLNMDYMFAFAYAYWLTGDTTWRSRMRGILKGAVNDAWYAGGTKWWTELALGSMGSYYDQLTLPAPSFPVCTVPPTGAVAAGVYAIGNDGTWSGTPVASEYEVWHWKMQATAGAIYHRISTIATASVAGLSGDLVKGRVRKRITATEWSTWADTAWTVIP